MSNFFQMNDWKIKKFLSTVLAFQLTLWSLIYMDAIGFKVPILRPLVGFIYLTFIPGFLILRVLRLHRLDCIEALLYAVGLSLSFLMLTGALINSFYPLIGISKPISETPLIFTISLIVLFLSFICYLRDKDYSESLPVKIFSPFALFLLLFPFLSVFGTYLLNISDSNLLLLVQIAIISIFPIFVAFNKLPEKIYPLAIWVIAISLLFQNSLPSMYMRLTDNVFEYRFANLVMTNGFWDPTVSSNLNAMLAIVMLLPIFSEICNMSLTWVYKIIVPILYSLVPLGLYHVFRKQTNEKIAFLSSFFFIACYEFYTWAGLTMKQVASGLFLMLFLLLIVNENMKHSNKIILSIIFALSLAVSHYGTSYIFMASLVAVLGIVPLILKIRKNQDKKATRMITPTFVVLYISFAIAWYMYVTSGSAFNTMTSLGHHIINSLLKSYFIPQGSYASRVLFGEWSLSLEIVKILSFLSVFFIIVGVIISLYKRIFKFNNEYVALSIFFVGVSATPFIGYLSGAATPDRIFHLITFSLAPFCVIGGITAFKSLMRINKFFNLKSGNKQAVVAMSIYLMIYLLFNTGFVSEVLIKDYLGAPIYISTQRIKEQGTVQEKEYLYREYVPVCDTSGGKWLSRNGDTTKKIYADCWGSFILRQPSYGIKIDNKDIEKLKRNSKVEKDAYIYLRKLNTKDKIFIISTCPQLTFFKLSEIRTLLDNKNKIYDNNNSKIYR